MLSEVFQESLGLSREQEDALWGRFLARQQREAQAWAAFAAAMNVAGARLWQAVAWAGWPAWGLRPEPQT
jgi:hypothetical protein